MNLNKNEWCKIKLGELFKLKSGNSLPHSKIIQGEYPVYGGNGIVGYHNNFMVEPPTIIIGRVGEYCGSVHLTKQKSWITDNGLYPIVFHKEINQCFLKELLIHKNLNQFAQKTGQPSISQSMVNPIEIPYPPIEEQKQIASLFQSIELAIEQLERQERNVLNLKTQLLREIFNDNGRFGSHLTTEDYEQIKFEKVAIQISERVEPKDTSLEIYVGLEHLDPDSLVIERTGKPSDVIGTKLKIYKGDIIFGKRRAYQRKIAVSHFDGIASAHSMILRANEKTIEKEFLPYFMQSDSFMSRAVQISEGSLSPTIKWKTLANQEFILPKKKRQKRLVELFSGFDVTLDQLKQQKATLRLLKQKLLNEILG